MEEQTMKSQNFKKFVFALITLLVLASQSYAGNVSKETISKIRDCIKEQVDQPGFNKITDGPNTADVIFTITDEGKLYVNRIISENEALSTYITERLSDIRFCCLESPMNQHYHIKLSFRVI